MLYIDGSYGEGGGQILRTSLSLAAITSKPICIENIRAGRSKPGLAAQHLTCVRAAAAICNAQVRGDKLGSTRLEFIPGGATVAGKYNFDVADAREGGSAGAVTLVLQTILLPLALASGDSEITLKGGTHVNHSPTFSYIEQVYLPAIATMNLSASAKLQAWGWYPQGGGFVQVRIAGDTTLTGINILERSNLRQVRGIAVVTELPSHIPNRMAHRAENILRAANLRCNIKPIREKGIAPGAGIFLTAEYKNILAGFGALGRQGIASEKVAELVCEELLNFDQIGAPVDVHLADQLLLPAALATSGSQYRVTEISLHLTTNAWVIGQFGLAQVTIDDSEKIVTVTP